MKLAGCQCSAVILMSTWSSNDVQVKRS